MVAPLDEPAPLVQLGRSPVCSAYLHSTGYYGDVPVFERPRPLDCPVWCRRQPQGFQPLTTLPG